MTHRYSLRTDTNFKHPNQMNIREKLSTLHRKLVVSYDEGEKLGQVTNLYFNAATCSLSGLAIAPRFSMSEFDSYISLKAIHRLGKNVVIISGKDNLEELPDDIEGRSLRDLKGIKVVTQEGKHLGELLDVNIFSKSGIISEILLYGPKKLKVDVKRDNLSIGPDAIIVPGKYEKRIREVNTTAEGGFVIHTGKTTLTVTESIKNAFVGMASKIQIPEEPTSKIEDKEEPNRDESNGRKLVSSK